MDPSKAMVILIILLIAGGVSAWSWVNFTKSPPYNPEIAQQYVQHFDRRCLLEADDESICKEVIGHHHRRCFNEHLQETPPERVDVEGPLLYSRPAYIECMSTEMHRLMDSH